MLPDAIASSSSLALSAIERSDSDSVPTVCATAICSAIRGVAYTHTDDWLLSADQTGIIKYWQTNFNNVKEIQAHDQQAIRGLAIAPTDSKFVTASDDQTLKMEFDAGQVTNASFADYKIPGMLDLPENMSSVVVDANQHNGPFGAKGVGESGTFGVSPAIANAVEDAIGVRITSLPITPEKIYRAIRAANDPLED